MRLARAVAILIVLSVFAGTARAAETRLATVDLTRILKASDSARDAEEELEKRAAGYKAELEGMAADLKVLGKEYAEARESVDNPALSEAARGRLKEGAVAKLTELKEAELAFRERKREIERTLAEQNKRMRERIVKKLREEVADLARKQGYDLVVDAITVVYRADAVPDLTDDVLKAVGSTP